jgi:hypothetical protein
MELNNTTNLAHQPEIWQTNSLTSESWQSDRHLLPKYRKLIPKIWELNVTEITSNCFPVDSGQELALKD